MADAARILAAIDAGDPKAADQLLPLVYDELRGLAAARLADESPGHTPQPTALVHEAYVRLVGPGRPARWAGRGHFFAAAAEAMRHILIDHARRKKAAKRGRAARPVPLDPDRTPAAGHDPAGLLALDDALARLAAADPPAAALVKLRVFAGRSVEEAGGCLGLSRASVYRTWTYARAWLAADLADGAEIS